MVLKVSPCYIYNIYITVLGQTDFEHLIVSIISSQSCFIEMSLLQNIYSKMVNFPYKGGLQIGDTNLILFRPTLIGQYRQHMLHIMKHYIQPNLKGIAHQFWIYNIFFVNQQKKHFLWKVYLNKTTLTRNNWENRVLKVSPIEYCCIYYIYNTDWL